jgi:hypothetical protein
MLNILLAAILSVTAAQPLTGRSADYRLKSTSVPKPSQVHSLSISIGPPDEGRIWISLAAAKQNGDQYTVGYGAPASPREPMRSAICSRIPALPCPASIAMPVRTVPYSLRTVVGSS